MASVSGRGWVVVGDDAVRQLAQQAGISDDQAADLLAQVVPRVVNGLTPNGQVPSDDELGRLAAHWRARFTLPVTT